MDLLSDEQRHILFQIKKGKNVIVDAVAGTGKTTLILSIPLVCPRKQIMQMTYNKSLKHEVREKIVQQGLTTITVHTYHSLAKKYYSDDAHIDSGIKRIILNNGLPIKPLPKINILILDELQDMTFLYFCFMIKFARDLGAKIQIVGLGDYMQGLYEFKGSDIRFLTEAEKIWRNHPNLRTKQFITCTMKTSYRITNQMCSFINNVLLGEHRMNAVRDGINVQYIRNTAYNIQIIVAAEILKLITDGVNPSDIFVIAPSVKGPYSCVRRLENMLVERGYPCHIPMLENGNIDERVIDKKIVFSTFHCVKGRQRPYVFVVGFDNSYFKYYAKNLLRDICPNTIYVACTRATKGLYLLESNTKPEDRPLEFLYMNHVEMKRQPYITFRGMHQTIFQDIEEAGTKLVTHLTPTEMIKFIPESVLEEISFILEKIFISETTMKIELNIPNIIETKGGFFEEVGDLNGIAIPAMYYDYLISTWTNGETESIMHDILNSNIDMHGEIRNEYLKSIIENLPKKLDSISDYLYIANVCLAIQESLFFKIKQIGSDEYNWLSEDIVIEAKNRLRSTIGKDCQNEQPKIEEYIIYGSLDEQHVQIDQILNPLFNGRKFRFTARVDTITENIIWELKCTSEISMDHKLQVVIYAWLWFMRINSDGFQNIDEKTFKIYNIKTNELLTLNASIEELNFIVVSILKGRFLKGSNKSTDEFLKDCELAINKL
jgi:hypothetical protein